MLKNLYIFIRYTFFCQITTFMKVCVAFVFRLKTLRLIDFTEIYQSKGLKPKIKGPTNFIIWQKVYLNILIFLFTDSRDSKNPTASKEGAGTIKGELKLTLEYRRQALHVMVCHAKNLANPDGSGKEPNSYVKVYLRPDPLKDTKRNTRVVKKNCHPSFMEPVS